MRSKKIIVDPNKPLPPILAKEYWETSAKLILEHFLPERFVHLSVDSERPDLRNSNVGVEVTSAEDPEAQEMDSLYTRQYSYGDDGQKERALKRIEELGGRVEQYFLAHPGRARNLEKLSDTVRTKTQKLNNNYDIFPENYLFIYDSCLILDQELSDILLTFVNDSTDYNLKFDSIFLYCFGGDLYEFNLLNKSYTHFNDSSKTIQQLVIDARHILNEKYKH